MKELIKKLLITFRKPLILEDTGGEYHINYSSESKDELEENLTRKLNRRVVIVEDLKPIIKL